MKSDMHENRFSNGWKKGRKVFQSLEKRLEKFPILGKFILASVVLFGTVGAALGNGGTDVTPTNGPFSGGNAVLVTNAVPDIGDGSDITNIVVGGVGTTNITGQGANWVAFTAPATGSAGAKDIVIQSTSVGDTTLANAYRYNPQGVIGGSEPGPNVWTNLGGGVTGGVGVIRVYSLALDGTALYVGGQFPTAGDVLATNVARWNGTAWTNLAGGLGPSVKPVMVLKTVGTNLYAGGDFTNSGGVVERKFIAQWNGSTWESLGSGMSASMNSLAYDGTNLYAGGAFTNAGGVAANYVAMWNGTVWTNLGRGMSNSSSPCVWALAYCCAPHYLTRDVLD